MNLRQDPHLDALALKVSKILEGEDLDDAASVCALLVVYAIVASPRSTTEKWKMLETIIEFMCKMLKEMPADL